MKYKNGGAPRGSGSLSGFLSLGGYTVYTIPAITGGPHVFRYQTQYGGTLKIDN